MQRRARAVHISLDTLADLLACGIYQHNSSSRLRSAAPSLCANSLGCWIRLICLSCPPAAMRSGCGQQSVGGRRARPETGVTR